ncbi:MAG: hypothetical protein R3Y59_03650 [bacterium]
MELVIHGVPSGFETWGSQSNHDYHKRFYQSNQDYNNARKVLILEVVNNIYYYTYLCSNVSNSNNRGGAYFAITLKLPNQYCKDVYTLYDLFETYCFNNYIAHKILNNNNNKYSYKISSFEDASVKNTFTQMSNFFLKSIKVDFKNDIEDLDASFTNKNTQPIYYNINDTNSQVFLNDCKKYRIIAISREYKSKDSWRKDAIEFEKRLKEQEKENENEIKKSNEKSNQISKLHDEINKSNNSINELKKKNTFLEKRNKELELEPETEKAIKTIYNKYINNKRVDFQAEQKRNKTKDNNIYKYLIILILSLLTIELSLSIFQIYDTNFNIKEERYKKNNTYIKNDTTINKSVEIRIPDHEVNTPLIMGTEYKASIYDFPNTNGVWKMDGFECINGDKKTDKTITIKPIKNTAIISYYDTNNNRITTKEYKVNEK